MAHSSSRSDSGAARAKADAYERSLSADARRAAGVHYTPWPVAAALCELGFEALGRTPRSVVDPSCGGGAFLIAAADRLADAGVPAAEVVTERLSGVDNDPEALVVARQVLVDWAASRGARVGVDELRIHPGDALLIEPPDWPAIPDGGHDMVVGNPPFLGQLDLRTSRSPARRAQLAARHPEMGAYTDDSALFLAAAVELVAPGGVVVLVQPQSVLSARDTSLLRDSLVRRSDLVMLWVHDGLPFADADVHVCAPVLRRVGPAGEGAASRRTEVVWQSDTGTRRWNKALAAPTRWGELLALVHGVPEVGLLEGPALRSIATATAGFRDEFYALCEASVECQVPGAGPTTARPLVTVGMIDPFRLRWGEGTHRLGGRRVRAPVLDEPLLREVSPKVARWVTNRRRPKVLVATQTKVLEVVVDPGGDLVPVTPTISIEPIDHDPTVWHLGAALVAPPVAAHAALAHLGSGRSPGSLRWSARSLLDVPLPVEPRAWSRGAELASLLQAAGREGGAVEDLFDEFARTMTVAYGLPDDHPVVEWWSSRRPRR